MDQVPLATMSYMSLKYSQDIESEAIHSLVMYPLPINKALLWGCLFYNMNHRHTLGSVIICGIVIWPESIEKVVVACIKCHIYRSARFESILEWLYYITKCLTL